MLKNYFKLTLRNLNRNRLYVFINVLGLGISLACCIVAYLNTRFGLDFDRMHVNRHNIYNVQVLKGAPGQTIPYGITPMALGPRIAQDIAAVDEVVRVVPNSMVLKRDKKVFTRQITFADPNFFNVFSFEVKEGSLSTFADKNQLIISEEMATAYFGTESAVGQFLTMVNGSGVSKEFLVGAVLKPIPQNSTFQFDAITQMDNFLDINKLSSHDWGRFVGGTFLYFKNGADPKTIEPLLEQYVAVQNQARPDWLVGSYYLAHMPDMPYNGRDIYAYWFPEAMHPAAFIAPIVMAVLILLIACFNFTNTSIASSSRRLKEIGIRKVIGGNRRQLILQFLSENIVLCFISMLIALGFAAFLVPAYSAMWPYMTLTLDLTQNPEIYVFLTGLLFLTAIIAGAYPSLYVSKFEPVKILRGSLKIGGSSPLSRVLLTLQFAFTAMSLVGSIAFYRNAVFQENADMGFEKQNIIGVELKSPQEYKTLRAAMEKNPDIIQLAGAREHIGFWNYGRTIKWGDVKREVMMMNYGPEYFEAMGLKVVEGRPFTAELLETDKLNSIMVNQKFAEVYGWENPIGQRVSISDSLHFTVIGIVKDFYANDFFEPVEPYAFRPADENDYNFLVARVPTSKITEVYGYMEEQWLNLFPDRPFAGFYQEDTLKNAKDVNKNIVTTFSFLGLISVLLSVIGLFTLVSLNVIKRVKEIGIRKVLGAEIPQILWLISRSFLLLICIAAILGIVGGFFVTDMLIASIFKVYQPIDMLSASIPFSLIIIIALATSFFKVLGAARQNPVKSLRYE